MSKTKVYIDGQSGTTGLQIFDRIGARDDLELLRIDEDKRHDNDERRKFINAADIVFLCLPDDGAREAVSLIENPDVRVIDASTAHRTNDDWTYGFPELSPEQRDAIAHSRRVANPGCHATGFISCAAPLVRMGIVPADYPFTCFSLTGYSGGGKKMIASYEASDKAQALYAPGIYGLTLHVLRILHTAHFLVQRLTAIAAADLNGSLHRHPQRLQHVGTEIHKVDQVLRARTVVDAVFLGGLRGRQFLHRKVH